MHLSCSSSSATNSQVDGKQTNIEALLAEYDQYLTRQVHVCMRSHSDVIRPEMFDLETDELVQRVRIKFWHALEDKRIDFPKTYIKRIVNSEFIDMVRRIKPNYTLNLPVDEEGEIYQGHMLITPSAGMADPSVEYEERVEASQRMEEIVDVVLTLPVRQQQAIICDMRDRVDDLDALAKAFKKRKTAIEVWQWPQQKNEKLLLRTSLNYARLKVSMHMKEVLSTPEQALRDNRRILVDKEESKIMEQRSNQNEQRLVVTESGRNDQIMIGTETNIDKLPEPYQKAMLLHCLEKCSYPEIAAKLGLPVGTVKSHVSRGKKLLSRYVEMNEIERESREQLREEEVETGTHIEIVNRLGKLQEPYRKAIELHYVEKRSYPEIATQLQLPVGTVKSHVSRGMKMLSNLHSA